MTPSIAIVGMACWYPDARSPVELWENVLAQRRAFRRIPPERLRLEDYLSADPHAPDCLYPIEAALIEGYEFDRVGFRVAGSTFRSVDLVHWLALDIASQALADAGFPEGQGLPRETTGVLLGNTLTGEFSRASLMRLRWPYVRRVVDAELTKDGWTPEQRRSFLEKLEATYKEPFPLVGEETLAGGLSNTIAGRICNHFDLKGGGYTVDGACAASLLAVTNACSALAAGDLDVALAGGVDLSLDPFELVGFAKLGALAPEQMRVFDARSAGFWPGEGCGFVVLMRRQDAVAQRRRIYALIRGWGVSSDGSGGITRPEVEGQLLAVQRAYRRAGVGIETVTYFEGHGTGTSVGDATELQVLSRARREAAPDAPPAAIGSIKANIGHTKAAAGVAGLIKATMALHTQILPPTTGCERPHAELTGEAPALRVLSEGQGWPADLPLRAGVSAMGFGGINTHLVLDGITHERRHKLSARDRALISSAQDAELFLLSATDATDLQRQVEHLLTLAPRLARAELADLSAELARRCQSSEEIRNPKSEIRNKSEIQNSNDHNALPTVSNFEIRASDFPQGVRAAVVASNPTELGNRLETLRSWLAEGATTGLDIKSGVFLGTADPEPRIGFLFPGQGSPAHQSGGIWRRRFEFARDLYAQADFPAGDGIATDVAQPAIVTASMAALRALDKLGIQARIAVGHSLGELTALHWAGAMDEDALLRIATARGKAMAELGSSTGAMASIGAGQQAVEWLLNSSHPPSAIRHPPSVCEPVVIAGLNSPRQTVISGEATAVAAVVARARAQGLAAVSLPVSHAFHSPLVAAAAPALAEHLRREKFQPLHRAVVSTVTGAPLSPGEDLPALLVRQVTSPVRFGEAVTAATPDVDLWIEVGSGQVLSGLVSEFLDAPVIALDAGGSSLKGLLQAVGATFALGASIRHEILFAGRFTRPFDLNWQPRFFANPCEQAPYFEDRRSRIEDRAGAHRGAPLQNSPLVIPSVGASVSGRPHWNEGADSAELLLRTSLEVVRHLVAQRVELPPSAVNDDSRLLSDLHLNSITVGQVVAEAARQLGLPPPVAPTNYADATVAQVAQALDELARTGDGTREDGRPPAGVDSWIRTFTVELVERPLRSRQPATGAGVWRVMAPADHPLAEPLQQALERWGGGDGVVVCLPPEPDEHHVGLLLEGARAALEKRKPTYFALVQHGGGGTSFARTLHLEAPELTTCVVNVPLGPASVEWVLAEIKSAVGYTEAHYDTTGRRWEPVLRLLPMESNSAELPLGPDDVLLVTGGGKGVTAECAFALAREMGARLVLLGRAQPGADAELTANLDRMNAAGIKFRYIVADVTEAAAVRAAVSEAVATFGPITGILHGAAVNDPQLLSSLEQSAFLRTVAVKIQGACNLLAAVDPTHLRLFVAFGSIIARTGLRGEAHYGLANEWLTRLTEQFQKDHPTCRCLAVEWSAWSGVGMAERLGGVEALARAGMTPITPDQGVSMLRRLLAQPLPTVSVVVTGRVGKLPTLHVEQPELPLRRFLEQPRVYYPGVELVADAELSTDTDPYLDDHVFQGSRLFPAVMGLEAMAQAAMALAGSAEPPVFEDVKFNRPVVVPHSAPLTIRVAALVREPGRVEVVLRSEETAFQVDHFWAMSRFDSIADYGQRSALNWIADCLEESLPSVPIKPGDDLYGKILFHGGRFRRLRGYRRLRATECVAEIAPLGGINPPSAIRHPPSNDWFGRYLPTQLVLGDPAARDAAIHAIQACIPHATLLPIGVDRLILSVDHRVSSRFVQAREREREGDIFTYDLEVAAADGRVIEQWEGLRLRIVADTVTQGAWVEPLLGPYVERRLQELIPASAARVVVERNGETDRRARSDLVIQRALGKRVPVRRRPDGKPELAGDQDASAAHAGDLAMAVVGPGPVGCDVEPVAPRPANVWRDLLGPERFALAEVMARELGEDQHVAATRVWAASECLKKADAMINAPLVLVSSSADGWVLLAAGPLTIATFVAPVRGVEGELALAVLVRSNDARL